MTVGFRSSIVLVLFVVSVSGTDKATKEPKPVALELINSENADLQFCESDEPCYFGYVRTEQDYGPATYRALQTW